MGVIVEDMSSVERLNDLLHEYGRHIIGRMGIPYRERRVSVISVVLDCGARRAAGHDIGACRQGGRAARSEREDALLQRHE